MAYNYDVEGWEDWNGNRFDGEPSDPEDAHGLYVHVADTEDSERQDWFWAYTLYEFETWDEWYNLIEVMNGISGLAYTG